MGSFITWTRTSSLLLALFVVSGLSFPHPDEGAYKIPAVGTGQRSQYYVLHSDGTFKYGFDTGDGAFESVKSHTVGNRDGSFGYVDPDGNTIRLEYEAGHGGFVARGDHLPKPSPELAQALAAVVRSSTPFVDPLASTDSDASYGFRFQSEDHSRNEESDADGTVTGSYSYVDENGVTRSFTYKAGQGIGFVIEGDGLTQDVQYPANTQQTSFRSTQGSRGSQHSKFRGAQSGSHHGGQQHSQFHVTHSQGQGTQFSGLSGTQKHSTKTSSFAPSRTAGGSVRGSSFQAHGGQQANVALTRSQTPGDASYSFSYDAGDHSRSENSDSDLNVDGSFSFVADDGNRRRVNYVAGSSTGFQAEGDHLPKAPEDLGNRLSSAAHSTSSFAQTRSSPGAFTRSHVQSTPFRPTSVTLKSSKTGHTRSQSPQVKSSVSQTSRTRAGHVQGAFEEANTRSSLTPQGPYSFQYQTSSHSRSESGDDSKRVRGNFAFKLDDDVSREITYEAGSSTGFTVEGAHLPVGPVVPGAPTGQPTGKLVPVSSGSFVDPLADSDSDSSYDFDFDSETYSRSETADEDGNVVGTYSVVDDDGTKVTYRFKAGKGVGFETEEISRTRVPAPVRPTPYRGPLAGDISSSAHGQSSHPSSSFAQNRGAGFSANNLGQTSRFNTGSISSTSTAKKSKFGAHSALRGPSSSFGSIRSGFQTPSRTSGSIAPPALLKSSASPSHSSHVFDGFTLHSYAHTPQSEKFGYVLKFDD